MQQIIPSARGATQKEGCPQPDDDRSAIDRRPLLFLREQAAKK
jgi:hypothetical protein